MVSKFTTYHRFSCNLLYQFKNRDFYKWNLTVSEQCCITCNGTTVPENTYINTEESKDKCGTVKTSYCRNLPGKNRVNDKM